MPLTLRCRRIADPDGHNPALLLRGDWLMVEIGDGEHVGRGEASHSRDDTRCEREIARRFEAHVRAVPADLDALRALHAGPFAQAADLVEATAMSAIDQALHDLIARREGVAVWRLYMDKPAQRSLPAYATINRALTARTRDDYERTVAAAVAQGFGAIKCAPFEAVTPDGNQPRQAEAGLDTLRFLRERFGDLSLRVDCHGRFATEAFRTVLPELEALDLCWIEEPLPIGPAYDARRTWTGRPMALGESLFRADGFRPIVDGDWADVIMPDPKCAGGFTALAEIARAFADRVEISPHNPSGPVASLAALHMAALSERVTSIEIPLILDPARAYYLPWLRGGAFPLPDGPGWAWGRGSRVKSLESRVERSVVSTRSCSPVRVEALAKTDARSFAAAVHSSFISRSPPS